MLRRTAYVVTTTTSTTTTTTTRYNIYYNNCGHSEITRRDTLYIIYNNIIISVSKNYASPEGAELHPRRRLRYKGGEEKEKTRSARRTSVASLLCVAVDLNESAAVSADDDPNILLPLSKIPVPRGLMIIIIIFPIPYGRWSEATEGREGKPTFPIRGHVIS